MPDSSKLSQDFKEFRFRRRYDHLLRFRLRNAKPNEIIKAARELGFKINAKDLEKMKAINAKQAAKRAEPIREKSALDLLKNFFKG
ncbi:hypothetical protein [Synechococcus sp. A15-62]|uniref:hypothetical protein n=1 Tax=Synechococcus sp. A15-62 TaxID=1050657 RepID=UPI0016489C2F|nr:hypothetical protein [Synechococcus sp. A15-62]